jgi:hypothetical protein
MPKILVHVLLFMALLAGCLQGPTALPGEAFSFPGTEFVEYEATFRGLGGALENGLVSMAADWSAAPAITVEGRKTATVNLAADSGRVASAQIHNETWWPRFPFSVLGGIRDHGAALLDEPFRFVVVAPQQAFFARQQTAAEFELAGVAVKGRASVDGWRIEIQAQCPNCLPSPVPLRTELVGRHGALLPSEASFWTGDRLEARLTAVEHRTEGQANLPAFQNPNVPPELPTAACAGLPCTAAGSPPWLDLAAGHRALANSSQYAQWTRGDPAVIAQASVFLGNAQPVPGNPPLPVGYTTTWSFHVSRPASADLKWFTLHSEPVPLDRAFPPRIRGEIGPLESDVLEPWSGSMATLEDLRRAALEVSGASEVRGVHMMRWPDGFAGQYRGQAIVTLCGFDSWASIDLVTGLPFYYRQGPANPNQNCPA